MLIWCIISTILFIVFLIYNIFLTFDYDTLKKNVLNQELRVWFSNVATDPICTKDFKLSTKTRVKISTAKDCVKIWIGTQEYKMTKEEFHKMDIEIEKDNIDLPK